MALLMMAACATSRIEVVRHNEAGLTSRQPVVLLARRNHLLGPEPEDSFLACLRASLDGGNKPLTLYPAQQFLDELFPWFEPRLAPTNVADMAQLLNRTPIAARLRHTQVRFLIWLQGDTETTDRGGGISCGLAPSGGGCIGFAWWDQHSTYEALIWDLQQSRSVGAVSAEVSGTSYLPAVIIPIPLIARTQGAACKGLAEQVEALLLGEDQ